MNRKLKIPLLLGGKKHRGNSILCNGTTYIDCGSDAGLDDLHAAAFTAEGWFYSPIFTGNYQSFINKTNGSAGWNFRFYNYASINIQVRTDTTSISENYSVNILNNWHHLAFCYDNAGDRKVYVYIDGSLVKITEAASGTIMSDAPYTLYIGSPPIGAKIGWVRISNFVRYTENFTPVGRLTPPDSDANTLALWKMNEGSETTVDNAEGTAARDGTIVNGAWVYSP